MIAIPTQENSMRNLASLNFHYNPSQRTTLKLFKEISSTTLWEKVWLDPIQECPVKSNSWKMIEKYWGSMLLVRSSISFITIWLMTLWMLLRFIIPMTGPSIFLQCIWRRARCQGSLLWINLDRHMLRTLSKTLISIMEVSWLFMEGHSILLDVMGPLKRILRRSITEISLLLQSNNPKQRNTSRERSHPTMVLVLKKTQSRMSIVLTQKDQRRTSSDGWTTRLSSGSVPGSILISRKTLTGDLSSLICYMMILFWSMNQKLEIQVLKEGNS